VAAVGIAVLGLASPAQAQITVTISDLESTNGGGFALVGAPVVLTGPNNLTPVGTAPGVNIGNFTGVTISVTPQLSGGKYITFDSDITANNSKLNGGGNTFVDQLSIVVSLAGVTFPPFPNGFVPLTTSLQGSSLSKYTGGAVPISGTDSGYALGSSTISNQVPAAPTFSTATLLGKGVDVGTALIASPSFDSVLGNASTTYLLTNSLLVFLTQGGSANVNLTTTVTVPEPSSMVMAFSGGLLMVAGGWVRRRNRG